MPADYLQKTRFRRSCVAIATALLLVPGSGLVAKERTGVVDLRYGVALYHYFQQDYFSALSELRVAQQKGGIHGHKTDAEVIAAGISLAFGMEQTAAQQFTELSARDRDISGESQGTAWYYLAKLHYQRGDWARARVHLAKTGDNLPKHLQAEVAALDIQLLMREGKFDEAEARLVTVGKSQSRSQKHRDHFTPWRPYLAFNLASRYVQQDKAARALPLLESIREQRLSADDNIRAEQLVMADKANTAAGYSYFEQGDYTNALDYFGAVRQSGNFSSDALLGYGWTAARLQNYPQAISAWQQLQQGNIAEEAVQESWLATPYAHLQLGLTDLAIEGYQQAEAVFVEQLKKIDAAGELILSQSLVELLDLENTNADYNWLQPENNTLVKPQLLALLELFSLNRFQYEVQIVRDLFQIRRRMQDWQQGLDAYDDLLDYRRKALRVQNGGGEAVSDPYKERQYNTLVKQYQGIRATLQNARANNNVYILLDEARADQLELVESAENHIQRLQAAGEDVSEQALWAKRYRGALEWSASQDFDARLWEQEAQLKITARTLESVKQGSAAVKQLLTEAPEIARGKVRIREYSARVQAVLAKNRELMDATEIVLRRQINVVLAEQRRQLQFYLAEARLAVAQIYDNIYLRQDNDQ